MENNSMTSNIEPPHIYTAEEVALVVGGISAAIGSIVYAFKNVNHLKSGCCECDQKVEPTVFVEDIQHISNNISEV
jgi:hypothetical protein